MAGRDKTLDKILRGTSDANIPFADLCQKMIRYEVIIYWSEEDQAFIVEVPELPGCMADGATYQEALANAEVIIKEWIETARELGRPIPEPRGRLVYA
jgi:predicted RNase H-like HicB family nuclease